MGIIRFFGKVLAFVLLVVFLVVFPLTLWTYNAQAVLFDQSTYDRVIQNDSMYTVFLPTLLPEIVNDVRGTADNRDAQYAQDFFTNLSNDEWQTATALLVPTDWLQGQIKNNVDAMFDWLESTTVLPPLEFDLEPLRASLTGQTANQTVSEVVGNRSDCNSNQMKTIQTTLDGDSGAVVLPTCQPFEADVNDQLVSAYTDGIIYIGNETPAGVTVDEASMTDVQRRQWLNIKLYMRVTQRISYLIFMVPAVVLLLIQIITVRTLREFLRWYGWALFGGGLVALLLLLPLSFSPLLAWQFATGSSRIDPAFVPVIASMTNLLNFITQPVLLQGAIVTVAGLVLVGLGSAVGGNNSE